MFSFKQSLWHFLINPKKICQKAKKIIAVSHSTKNDIVDVYKINPEKIKVIYNAVSSDFKIIDRNNPRFLEIKKKYRLPYRFILYLGAMEPRKNILAIIRAYNQMRLLKNPELEKYRLVIAGAKGWNNGNIKKEMQKSAFNKDIISIGFIEADEKPFIYNLASLFVYPSFFEGFGIPPLEAMKSGVPVVVSNNSSLPEIVGKAGLLVDPDRPDEICIAMKEIILNKELKEKLIKEGIKRAENFSWEKSAREFIDLIKN
jgi:glycosyltransferase involved in cell wall biosynthesis